MEYKFKELVEGFKNGDKKSGEKLIAQLQPLIFSTVCKYGFGLSREDLYQEAAVAILEGIHQFDPDKGIPFLTYIKTKLKFHIYNRSRKYRAVTFKNVSLIDEEGNDILENLPDPGHKPDELILSREDSKSLAEALKKLDERQQKVIRMHFFEGYALKDVARELGFSYKTAIRIKARAIEILSRELSII